MTVLRCTECGLRGNARVPEPSCMCFAPLEPVELIAVGVPGCVCGACELEPNGSVIRCAGALASETVRSG